MAAGSGYILAHHAGEWMAIMDRAFNWHQCADGQLTRIIIIRRNRPMYTLWIGGCIWNQFGPLFCKVNILLKHGKEKGFGISTGEWMDNEIFESIPFVRRNFYINVT